MIENNKCFFRDSWINVVIGGFWFAGVDVGG